MLLVLLKEICLTCAFPLPKRLKDDFGCFEEKYTGPDTLIVIAGFYSKMEIHDHRDLYGMKNGQYQQIEFDTTLSLAAEVLFVRGNHFKSAFNRDNFVL